MPKQPENTGDIVIYESGDGLTRIDVTLDCDTVWLPLGQIAQLFGRDKSTISRHLKNIFAEGELERNSVVAKNATTAVDGKTYQVDYYNLDCIISVGYRVNSHQATAFRQWATDVLREYLVKGFTLDDERLKGGGGGAYWHELLDRIRDIRSSEKVLYRQVLDLYATAVDYDPKAPESRLFFKTVQNNLHFSAYGQTAAKVIFGRADASEPFMGLTSFRGDAPTLADVRIAKNYLTESELKRLNVLVSAYFDAAEFRAMDHVPTCMQDFVEQLDSVQQATLQDHLAGRMFGEPLPSNGKGGTGVSRIPGARVESCRNGLFRAAGRRGWGVEGRKCPWGN